LPSFREVFGHLLTSHSNSASSGNAMLQDYASEHGHWKNNTSMPVTNNKGRRKRTREGGAPQATANPPMRPTGADREGEEEGLGTGEYDDEEDLGADETTGRWTAEEHKLFLEGIMLYGKDWKKMLPLIKTRTLVQIRTHAQKVFKKIAGKTGVAGHSSFATSGNHAGGDT